jgi:asparagine synthase (glutamine-hydrolysing)
MGCFVAIVNLDGAPADERLLRTMLDVTPYRRPADTRLWLDGAVGLGFVPLRADHDAAGLQQPAVLAGAHAVLDGRFDRRRTLIERLVPRASRDLRAASDAELLLDAYAAAGIGCVDHLQGDFAFCVWDADGAQLVCARDRFGVKPLYVAAFDRVVVVSNVLRAVRRHPAVTSRLRPESVGDFLLFGCPQEPAATMFADVGRVPPGHRLVVDVVRRRTSVTPYWSLVLDGQVRHREPGGYIDECRHRLSVAVGDRVRDAPAGVMMTGGLDSTSVAATAVALRGGPDVAHGLRACTAVYDHLFEDHERHFSDLAGRALGIPVDHLTVDGYRFFERWDADALPPEPSTEPLSAIAIDLLARASPHVSMMLTGEGGDPMLLPGTVAGQFGVTPLPSLAMDVWGSLTRHRVRPPLGLRAAVTGWCSRNGEALPSWVAGSFGRAVDLRDRWARVARRETGRGPRAEAAAEVLTPWWAAMFEEQDPGATRQAIDVANPFFDVDLAAFLLRLPPFPWCVRKTILREAMRGLLPEPVRTRRKSPLGGDPLAARGGWTVALALEAFAAAEGIAEFVDVQAFAATVDPSTVMTDDAPGSLAAVCLATWLRHDQRADPT